jgi:hypothetical protein
MTLRFEHAVAPGATEIRLLGPRGAVPTDLWAVEAPPALLPGVDLAQRLVAAGGAIAEGDTLLVEHATIAGLTPREAGLLALPPLAEVRAVVEGNGLLTRPDFSASLLWQRPTGQSVLGAERVGAWLRIGDSLRRLPDTLFAIAEAVDRLNAIAAEDTTGRLAAIAALREALPPAEAGGGAEARGMLGRVTIMQADAFSLDLQGEGDDARLVPILRRAGEGGDSPLLPPDRQRALGEDQFHRFSTARPHYTLGDEWIVVLSPPLRRALAEVRRVASAPPATRKALLASPRAFLRQALGDEVEGTVLESIFRETAAWSDRVVGLGLWQPRILSWITLPGTDWFGPETGGAPPQGGPHQRQGLVIDGRQIPLDAEAAAALQARVEEAIGAGRPAVPLAVDDESISVPANHDTLAALQKLEAARLRPAAGAREQPRGAPEVLIIRPNETEVEVEVEGEVELRPAPPARPPPA